MEHGNFWQHLRTSLAAVITAQGAQQPASGVEQGANGPRILVLTSGLGCGHVRAAEAVRLALLQRAPGATIQVLDWWSLINKGVAHELHEMYLNVVQEHAALYERIYQLDEQTWRQVLSRREPPPPSVVQFFELLSTLLHASPKDTRAVRGTYASDRALLQLLCSSGIEGKSLVAGGVRAKLAWLKWSWLRLAHRLAQRLVEFNPDVVVSTQMIPAALVSYIKLRRNLSVPCVAVPTDFGVHDFWVQPGTDLYCLGHEMITELPRGLNTRQVICTGFPLMPQFTQPIDAVDARRELGIKLDSPVVLILGGGLGLGVDVVAERLLHASVPLQLLVLAGRNARVGAKLSALAMLYPGRIKNFDWTDRVDLFMRAADLVVGKPGGLSVAEVLACGRPLLATQSLRGQEDFNVHFLEAHQAGLLLSDEQLVTRIEFLLTHPSELGALQTRAWNLGRRNGASQIAEQVLGLASGEQRATEYNAWQRS